MSLWKRITALLPAIQSGRMEDTAWSDAQSPSTSPRSMARNTGENGDPSHVILVGSKRAPGAPVMGPHTAMPITVPSLAA
jgi:hypothetical protein